MNSLLILTLESKIFGVDSFMLWEMVVIKVYNSDKIRRMNKTKSIVALTDSGPWHARRLPLEQPYVPKVLWWVVLGLLGFIQTYYGSTTVSQSFEECDSSGCRSGARTTGSYRNTEHKYTILEPFLQLCFHCTTLNSCSFLPCSNISSSRTPASA